MGDTFWEVFWELFFVRYCWEVFFERNFFGAVWKGRDGGQELSAEAIRAPG